MLLPLFISITTDREAWTYGMIALFICCAVCIVVGSICTTIYSVKIDREKEQTKRAEYLMREHVDVAKATGQKPEEL